MQIVSYFGIYVYEKLLELLLMPAVDLISDDTQGMSKIAISTVVIVAIIIPYFFISFISLCIYNQSKVFHPAAYYAFLSSSITVGGICDGLKMRYSFWPLVDNLYQIIYAILAVYTTPIVPSVVALVYFIIVWIFRPNVLGTDNIILSGEPFALFIFNLIVFVKRDSIPTWLGAILVVLAFIPVVAGLVWYYARQKGHDFEFQVEDMQYELDKRRKKDGEKNAVKLINPEKQWKIFQKGLIIEERTYLFMKHYTLVEPTEYEEDEFPAPSFLQKFLDIRSSVYIDVLCSCAFTVGAFMFYLQIAEFH